MEHEDLFDLSTSFNLKVSIGFQMNKIYHKCNTKLYKILLRLFYLHTTPQKMHNLVNLRIIFYIILQHNSIKQLLSSFLFVQRITFCNFPLFSNIYSLWIITIIPYYNLTWTDFINKQDRNFAVSVNVLS